jgi:hypothetical protein
MPPVVFTVPPETFAPMAFLHWQRFAGEHGFIHGCAAFHNFAVHGNFLAGTHAQPVARMHGIQRHVFVALRRDAAGGFWREAEQRFDRAAGALAGA